MSVLLGEISKRGEVQKSEDFVDWKQPEPELGSLMPMTCNVCGGRWMRLDDICIEGEWRKFAAFKDVVREEIAPGSYRIQGTKIIWRKP